MTLAEHERVMRHLAAAITHHDWDRLGEAVHDDAVWEYPQSGEVFRGLANIRGQLEHYPDIGPGTSQLTEVIGEEVYALTPSYTVIRVDGAGSRGTAVIRVHYPDDSLWWVVNLYELRDGRIIRSRAYFAPDFEAPEWRAPYREAP